MARSRIIRPEFWNDEKLAKLSRDSRLTFIGLWTCADDYGVSKGNLSWLKSQIFPYDEDLKISKFESWIAELERSKIIIPFQYHDEKFYYIKTFTKHQKVDHPSKRINPEPPENILCEDYSYLSNILAKDSRDTRGETETETETEYKQKQRDYPDWLDLKLWGCFKAYRKEIKSPVTKHGEKLLLADLEKLISEGNDQTQVIEQTIKSGKWKGLFKVKNGFNQPECTAPYQKILRREDDCKPSEQH